MIPAFGPAETESTAEISLYWALKHGLPEAFIVIHSLPWLVTGLAELQDGRRPTGEVDFVVLHPDLGLLVLEVKGGRYRVEKSVFTLVSSGRAVDVVGQTRRNFHGLTRWLGAAIGLRLRCGYGFVFPDSNFGDKVVSAAMSDVTVGPAESILVDKGGMPNLAERVVEIMRFWQRAHGGGALGEMMVQRIVSYLCPDFDGTVNWASRILYDGKMWLRLTPEQATVVAMAVERKTLVVSGWPGTGKTLIGIEIARKLAEAGKKVLFVTFNARLAEHIEVELSGPSFKVSTWHKLCADARRSLRKFDKISDGWFQDGCCEDLSEAIDKGSLATYDAIIVDETQALRPLWCVLLAKWFASKQIIAFCDESQSFSFESGIDLTGLCKCVGVDHPFLLTVVMRMPKAVTNRLLAVRPPPYQLSSPRDEEPEAIRECLHDDSWATLRAEVERLKGDGVDGKDICVLMPFEESESLKMALRTMGVKFEVVSRFRGLESPIVIILQAAEMDDAQLFCAYSRATTACIAIYSIDGLSVGAKKGFHRALLADERHLGLLTEARRKSATNTLLSAAYDQGTLSLATIDLAWSRDWQAWLVRLPRENYSGITWLDYLVERFDFPIYFWDDTSQRMVSTFACSDPGELSVGRAATYRLHSCEVCEMITPHASIILRCIFCSDPWPRKRHRRPSSEEFETIKALDEILVPAERVDEERKLRIQGLPIPLAAAAARHFAFKRTRRSGILDAAIPGGKRLYRSALAFVQARIALAKPGAAMSVDDVASDLRERYDAIAALDHVLWRTQIALAFGTCFQKGLVTKASGGGKGRYVPVDD